MIGSLNKFKKTAEKDIEVFTDNIEKLRIKRLNPKKMTVEEKETLINLFRRPTSSRFITDKDQKFMTETIKDLPFFIRFTKEQKLFILENSELVLCKGGDLLFEEGDIGTSMYVLLLGSVNVMKKARHPLTNQMVYKVNSL
jgi:hypothetical protein